MAASDEWTEWHLTPRGWEAGSNKMDFAQVERVPDPEGSVLVYCVRTFQSSIYSKEERSVDLVRGSPTAAEVVALLQKFGRGPLA